VTGVVRTDETGLHAIDCECVRCESGHRPTELERAAARRSLAMRRAAAERQRQADERAAKLRRPPERHHQAPPPPLTPEQQAELDREYRKLFGARPQQGKVSR
jgi:hypothetical protein